MNKTTLRRIKRVVIAITMLTCITYACAQQPDPKYFNEVPPDITPKKFASGKVSLDNVFEFGSIFSKDMREFYYAAIVNGRAETRMMKFENGAWSQPVKILFHDVYSFNDPFLTPDNQKLFFISNRPLSGSGPEKDYDLWYVERQSGKWSEPKNAGKNINSDDNEYYVSFTNRGKIYFSSNRPDAAGNYNYEIYSSELKNGEFQPAVKLSTAINTPSYEADVYVAPDESYVIFSAKRPDAVGSGDLYVSFRKKDGTWTPSKSLGTTINTATDDFCPFVSPDGKYLFYSSQSDIYWVALDVIERLR